MGLIRICGRLIAPRACEMALMVKIRTVYRVAAEDSHEATYASVVTCLKTVIKIQPVRLNGAFANMYAEYVCLSNFTRRYRENEYNSRLLTSHSTSGIFAIGRIFKRAAKF